MPDNRSLEKRNFIFLLFSTSDFIGVFLDEFFEPTKEEFQNQFSLRNINRIRGNILIFFPSAGKYMVGKSH